MTITLITFDLDNTLWDVEPALVRAEQEQQAWLARHRPRAGEGLDDESLLAFKKAVWKRNPDLAHDVTAMRRRMLYELQREAAYSHSEATTGTAAAFEVFLEERQQVDLYPGALEVLQHLAGRYTLAALTNGNADIFKTDAAPYFTFALRAEDIGAAKPEPDMFHAALERAGASADQAVHVGDDPNHDIYGAHNAGLRSVWFNNRDRPWSDGAPPHAEITHLSELADVLANWTAR
ncbi:MAG: HAD-IA family hydrolase [Pseudomonadota bacterium]